jgi:hypothetical protein
MIMRLWAFTFVVWLSLLITGCGSTAINESNSMLAGSGAVDAATVYFLRPDFGESGFEASTLTLSLRGEKLLTLAKGNYALVSLRPGAGEITVEAMAHYSESATKTEMRTVKEGGLFQFDAGKTYHVALCRRYRGRQSGKSSFPFLVDAKDAGSISTGLTPSGDAVQRPLMALADPLGTSDAVSDLGYRCSAVDNWSFTARSIESDCVKVNTALRALQKEPVGQDDVENFCAGVLRECAARPSADECKRRIHSYDRKRYGSGTSALMSVAGTRQARYPTGNVALMRSLLDLGFDPNARTGGASTDPLMEYIAPGYAGRSANGQWHDVTPLMIATAIGDHRMMRMLLRAGADPDIQNDQGYTALMIAANLQGNLGAKRTQIASDLLSSGAKADAVSSADGSTALMFAAYNGYMEIVKLLLDHGAGTAHADRTGVTALDIARTRGHADIAELLRKRGQAPGH